MKKILGNSRYDCVNCNKVTLAVARAPLKDHHKNNARLGVFEKNGRCIQLSLSKCDS